MGPCTHGMPTPGSCVDCMDEGNLPAPERPPAPRPEFTFRAVYDGSCAGGCGLPIHEHQLITRFSDGSYRHKGCVE